MRFLHTADWHIGKIVNDFSMLEYQRDMIDQIVNLLIKTKYDCLIIAGDLYDRSLPSQESMQLVNEAFNKIVMQTQTPILLISGNHDSGQLIEYGSEFFKHQSLFAHGLYQDGLKKVSIGDTDFYLFPFISPVSLAHIYKEENIKTYDDVFRVVLSKTSLDFSRQNVLIAHGYFVSNGQVIEKEDSVRPLSVGTAEYVDVKWLDAFDYVACGHLHGSHHIGSKKVQYSGSLLKYSLSEVKHKISVTDVTLENHQLDTKRIELNPTKDMIQIQGYYEEIIKDGSQDFVFFDLLDSRPILDAMNLLRVKYPYAMGLTYQNIQYNLNPQQLTQNEIASQSTLELFSDFFTQFKPDGLSDTQQNFVSDVFKESQHETN